MRKLGLLTAITALAATAAFVSPAVAASGGGCQLDGTAAFSPPLTNDAKAFSYGFTGKLSNCQSSDAGSPASGSVEAGQVVTDPSGEKFQEPVPSGNGSCANGTTNGTPTVHWAGGTLTVFRDQTVSSSRAVPRSGPG